MPNNGPRRPDRTSVYLQIVESIFLKHYEPGAHEVPWDRTELESAARDLEVRIPRNLGDVIYSVRYRRELPAAIRETQPDGMEWTIEGRGTSRYAFVLRPIVRILPNQNLLAIKIPLATPEIISKYSLSDEQALLAQVRYNRMIDTFLGVTAYSLQNHLRTSVAGIGQIEIDELYVGVNARGEQFIIPVQAKGGSDQLSTVQVRQDLAFCSARFPSLTCRAVAAQFVSNDLIALFELTEDAGDVKVCEERHYRLVAAEDISEADLRRYSGTRAPKRET